MEQTSLMRKRERDWESEVRSAASEGDTPRYFVHPKAVVETEAVGEGTRIWAFAHVLPDAVIGAECNICDHVFIENDVRVGDRVTVKSGVQLWDGVELEDDVFVGPNVTFSNDPFPRSKARPESFARTVVHRGASIGSNATLLPGIAIGRNAMIGAGTVVTKDVPPNAVVVGHPAYIKRYLDTDPRRPQGSSVTPQSAARASLAGVRGVGTYRLPTFADLRGSLAVAEFAEILPFTPQRFFVVYDVPSREARGEHAHKKLHQFLVCLKGECSLMVDDGLERAEIRLDSPSIGVHLGPMVWAVQYRFSPDAVLFVLASEPYDPEEYIREYEDFLEVASERREGTRS